MEKNLNPRSQKGQVLLIVVLVMVIGLTIGLSIASKSIISLKTSSEQAESQKALAAAEAGIEQSIKNSAGNASPITIGDTHTTYSASYTNVSSANFPGGFPLNGGNQLSKNQAVDIWFSDQSYNNQISTTVTVYWGDSSGACNNAALEIAVLSNTKANPVVTKYAVDPCPARRTGTNGNNFSVPGPAGTVDKTYPYSFIFSVTNGFFARVIPLYANNTIAAVKSNPANLPVQGSTVTSTGSSGSTQRKVTVFQSFPQVPSEYFPYSLFAP